jgi:hypothetical protein
MIKFGVHLEDGKHVIFLGMSFGNLNKFRKDPCDTFIKIEGNEIELDADVVLFSCRTEKEGVAMLQKMFNIPQEVVDRLLGKSKPN